MNKIQKTLQRLESIKPEQTLVWLSVVLFLKGLFFLYFAFQFQQHWPQHLLVNNWAVLSGDSRSYFEPIHAWLRGDGYAGACRMPGILPIYAPLAILFNEPSAKVVVVVLQWLMASVAIYAFSLAIFRFCQSKKVFLSVLLLLSVSTFVGIWDHYLYMESFAVSALLFATFFLEKMLSTNTYRSALCAGVFLAWAIFLRPVLIMFVPILLVLLMLRRIKAKQKFTHISLVFFPLAIALFAWNVRNYTTFNRVIFMQDSFDQCYAQMKTHHLHLRDLIIAWGGDFQEWSVGTEFAFFLQKKENPSFQFPAHVFTTAYTVDSLIELRKNYQLSLINSPERQTAITKVSNSAIRFREAYIREKPTRYYVLNRLELLRKFIAGGRVDNLPLAAKEKMSSDQWVIKLFATAMFTAVMLLGCISAVILSFRRNVFLWWLAAIPLSTILLLGPVLGFIEQRYLVPVYPFLVASICLFFFYYWPSKKGSLWTSQN